MLVIISESPRENHPAARNSRAPRSVGRRIRYYPIDGRPKFQFPLVAGVRDPLLSRMVFFARYESLLQCLALCEGPGLNHRTSRPHSGNAWSCAQRAAPSSPRGELPAGSGYGRCRLELPEAVRHRSPLPVIPRFFDGLVRFTDESITPAGPPLATDGIYPNGWRAFNSSGNKGREAASATSMAQWFKGCATLTKGRPWAPGPAAGGRAEAARRGDNHIEESRQSI
jgi:hypothetical protein